MPLTLQQRDELLRRNGYDPAFHELDELTGDVYKKAETSQPSASAPSSNLLLTRPDQKSNEMGAGKAFMLNVAESALPVAAGTLAQLGTASKFAKFGGPWGFLASTGLGAAATYAASKLQEPFLPEQFKQDIGQAREQQKTASFAGQVAPMLIPGKPLNPAELWGALKATGKLLTNIPREFGARALTEAEKRAAIHLGANVGVGGGLEAGAQALTGGDWDIPRILGMAATGGILSKPRAWTERFYPAAREPVQPPLIPRPENVPLTPGELPARPEVFVEPALSSREREIPVSRELLTKQFAGKKLPVYEAPRTAEESARRIAEIYRPADVMAQTEKEIAQRALEKELLTKPKTDILQGTSLRPSELNKIRQSQGLEVESLDIQRQRDVELVKLENERAQREIDYIKAQREIESAKHEQALEQASRQSLVDIERGIAGEALPRPPHKPVGENVLRITKPAIERSMQGGELEKIRPGTIRLSEKAKVGSKVPLTEEEKLARGYFRTQEEALARAKTLGVPVREGVQGLTHPETGEPIAGRYIPETGQVEISPPGLAGAETILHEVGHDVHARLKRGDAKDQALANRGEYLFGSEEPLVTLAGEIAGSNTLAEAEAKINTKFLGLKRVQLKNYLRDVVSNLKYKMGLDNENDVARLLAGRIRFQESGLAPHEARAIENLRLGTTARSLEEKRSEKATVGSEVPLPEHRPFVESPYVDRLTPEKQAEMVSKMDNKPEVLVKDTQTGRTYKFRDEGMTPGYGTKPGFRSLTAKERNPFIPMFGTNSERTIIEKGGEIQNAIQEQSPGSVLQREQSKIGETGSERGRVEPSVKREETPSEETYREVPPVHEVKPTAETIAAYNKSKNIWGPGKEKIPYIVDTPGSPYLDRIIVPEYERGKGLGSLALKDWEAQKLAEGHKEVNTIAKNEKSKRFFEKNGWVAGEEVWDEPKGFFGRYKIGTKMTKKLVPPEDVRLSEKAKIGSEVEPPKPAKRINLGPFTPEIEAVRNKATREHEIAASAGEKFYGLKRENQSKYVTELIAPFEEVGRLSKEDKERFSNWMIDNRESKGKPGWELPAKLKGLAEKVHKILFDMPDEWSKEGMKIHRGEDFTAIKKEPWGYWPYSMSEDAVRTITKGGKGEQQIAKLWQDHAISKGATPEEAAKEWKALVNGLGFRGRDLTSDIQYGPLFKTATQRGLPKSLIEMDPIRNLERYGRRAGAAFAYFKAIQNDPQAAHVLSLKNQQGQYWETAAPEKVKGLGQINTQAEVQEMMKSIYGVGDQQQMPNFMAAARLIVNAILGHGTAARNIVQIPGQISAYEGGLSAGLKAAKELWSGYKELKGRAMREGSIRKSYRSFDVPTDENYDVAINRWQNFANKASQVLRTVSLRNASDQLEGMFYHSVGEHLASSKIATKSDPEFLRKFGKTVDKLEDKISDPSKFTPEDVQKIAGSFVDTARGSYDPRQLPTMAMRGQLAPFFSINRWSIGKGYTMTRDLINPIRERGDWKPFVKTLATAMGTGYLVEQLNELLSGKRGVEPTTKEALEAGDVESITTKAVDLLQLASFMGIMSDFAKIGIRTYQGKDIKYASPVSFPLYTWTTDTIAKNFGDASQAIQEGEDKFDVLGKLIVNIGANTIQTLRYVKNYADMPETKRKEAFRDYRVWQELTGQREPESSATMPNEFRDLEAKKFKRTQEPTEAAEMLPDLVATAIEKSKNRDGTIQIDLLRKSLRSLKQNNYQIMPSPEEYPTSFLRYLTFLQKTQGDEAANERLVKFLTQRQMNQMKSSWVPSL